MFSDFMRAKTLPYITAVLKFGALAPGHNSLLLSIVVVAETSSTLLLLQKT